MISTVIPVRNNPAQLERCLESLDIQLNPPEFEVVVVDDGSFPPIPAQLGRAYSFEIRVVRQVGLGVSAARNNGISKTEGDVILFVDSDVVLDRDFLFRIAEAVASHPGSLVFQASLRGGSATLVQRMENLRLIATQRALESGDGHVRYINTSALAVRRSFVDPERDLFDVSAIRGEDSLLFVSLANRNSLPVWVDRAHASHLPGLSLLAYIWKHLGIGYFTTPARNELAKLPVQILLGGSGRRRVLHHMLIAANEARRDTVLIPLLALAHLLERMGRVGHRLFGLKGGRREVLGLPVDCVRESELVSRIVWEADRGRGATITYLTAWTLVQADGDSSMSDTISNFNICYPDGMGVVLCSGILNGTRLHKVTANNFFEVLCEQIALMELSVAIIGSTRDAVSHSANFMKEKFPAIRMVASSHGFLSLAEKFAFEEELRNVTPQIVVVGMGQPMQEEWVLRMREMLPNSIFLCVGGLFDYICGIKPTPPAWMRRMGLEWLFILVLRPRRYWKRYIMGLPKLFWLVTREIFSRCGSSLSAACRN